MMKFMILKGNLDCWNKIILLIEKTFKDFRRL